MIEIPDGISLTERDDDFLLCRKEADGSVAEIAMSEAELLALLNQLSLWQVRMLSRMQEKSGSARAIVVHPVSIVAVFLDSLEENLLLQCFAPTGQDQTLSLPLRVGRQLAADIPEKLKEVSERGRIS